MRKPIVTKSTPVAPRSKPGELVISFLGHATTLLDMDGTRLLTDPILRPRVRILRRHVPLPDIGSTRDLDAVLLSHLHLDHADIPSLAMLPPGTTVMAPVGTRAVLPRRRFPNVREISPGDVVSLGSVTVTATPAKHRGLRYPWSRSAASLGYLVRGSHSVYFAGDTGLFPELADLSEDLDVALLPVSGWGFNLSDDHLSPETAASALRLLRPRIAIPIHWGTLLPLGAFSRHAHHLSDPPSHFVRHAESLAPDVQSVVLRPGQWARICDSHLVS